MRPAGAVTPEGTPEARRPRREQSQPNLASADGANGTGRGDKDPEGLPNSQGWSRRPPNAGMSQRDLRRARGAPGDTTVGVATILASPRPRPSNKRAVPQWNNRAGPETRSRDVHDHKAATVMGVDIATNR